MPKIRGYVDTLLLQQAIGVYPDLALIDSTSEQISFVFKKAIALGKGVKKGKEKAK